MDMVLSRDENLFTASNEEILARIAALREMIKFQRKNAIDIWNAAANPAQTRLKEEKEIVGNFTEQLRNK